MKMYEAQATREGNWEISDHAIINRPMFTLTGDEFGVFLHKVRRLGADVLIHRFADDCMECFAYPDEDHHSGCPITWED